MTRFYKTDRLLFIVYEEIDGRSAEKLSRKLHPRIISHYCTTLIYMNLRMLNLKYV